jgi:DNA (cytosine-5)-methyltransferase 1
MSLKFISICSGIEAASVAWEPLGWTPLAFSEIEPFPCAVLKHHYPHVPNFGDMTKFDEWPEDVLAECDVLVGGCPCQAFSVAGLRQSLADARGNLTLVFVKLINHIDAIRSKHGRPPIIIVYENVPGILSTGDNAFGNFLGALSGEDGALQPPGGKWTNAGLVCGPTRDLAWRVLDAQYFGVAQRRRRVFLVGHSRAGALRPVKVLLVEQGVQRHSAPSRETGQRAAPTLAARTRGGGGLGTDFDLDGGLVRHDGGVGGVAIPLLDASKGRTDNRGSRDGSAIGDNGDPMFTLRAGSSHGVAHVVAPPLTASNDPSRSPQSSEVTQQVEAVLRATYLEVAEVCGTISDGAHNGGGLNGQDAYTGRILPVAFAQNQLGEVRVSDVIGTLNTNTNASGRNTPLAMHPVAASHWDGDYAHPTLNQAHNTGGIGQSNQEIFSQRGSGLVGNMAVRRLLPVECERLQGFPDEYTRIPWKNKPASECPDGPRYKALGNSMAVPCMMWIGQQIQKAMT